MESVGFGHLIRSRRLELGFTLLSLGEKVGVNRAAIWQWEQEKCFPRRDKRHRLCSVLGLDEDLLIRYAREARGSLHNVRTIYERICPSCKEEFLARTSKGRYCSRRCWNRGHPERNKPGRWKPEYGIGRSKRKPKIHPNCLHCHSTMPDSKKSNAKYCDEQCRSLAGYYRAKAILAH